MQFKYILLTIVAAIGWGFSGTCSEHLFKTYGTNGEWLTSIRLLTAGLLLILISLASGQGRALLGILRDKRDRWTLLFFAVIGMMAVQYTYLTAIAHTNSGTATVLQYSGPAFVLFYICLTTRRLPTWRESASLVGILVGVFLIATHGDITTLAISRAGLAWGMASAVFLAAHDIIPVGIIQRWGSLPTGWIDITRQQIRNTSNRRDIMEPIIDVQDVTKSFKNATVLSHISVSFEKGKIHGFIGRNGSGKTVAHNFGLAASGEGPTANGKIAVVIGIAVVLVIACLNTYRNKRGEEA